MRFTYSYAVQSLAGGREVFSLSMIYYCDAWRMSVAASSSVVDMLASLLSLGVSLLFLTLNVLFSSHMHSPPCSHLRVPWDNACGRKCEGPPSWRNCPTCSSPWVLPQLSCPFFWDSLHLSENEALIPRARLPQIQGASVKCTTPSFRRSRTCSSGAA